MRDSQSLSSTLYRSTREASFSSDSSTLYTSLVSKARKCNSGSFVVRDVDVGYGTGNSSALGVLDVRNGTKVADIKLSGHPESFQVESSGQRIFVNVPTMSHIAVVDREKGDVVETWSLSDATENFPMALDETNHRLLVGTRSPAKLLILDTDTGKPITSFDSSGDADDIFYDSENKHVYVSGGEGAISVFEQTNPDNYRLIGEVDTAEGARTSLFVP